MARVRQAQEEDRQRIREIQTAALAEPWPGLLDVATGEGPVCLVVEAATDDGDDRAVDRVVGYAVALTPDDSMTYVPELAVDPDFQGQGYGSALLSELVSEVRRRGLECARLTVREGDTRAQEFYEDHGFETVDRVSGHFASADGLVFQRDVQ